MTEGCRPSWPGRDDGRLARLGGVIDGRASASCRASSGTPSPRRGGPTPTARSRVPRRRHTSAPGDEHLPRLPTRGSRTPGRLAAPRSLLSRRETLGVPAARLICPPPGTRSSSGITHPSPDGESLLVGLAFCALGWRGESRALRTEPIAVRFLGCLRGENGELATAESAGLHAGKVRGTGEHRQGARQEIACPCSVTFEWVTPQL